MAAMMLGNSFRRLSKDQNGNMVTDITRLYLWRAHFNAILSGDDTNNSANEMIRPIGSVAPPDREEDDQFYSAV